MRLIYCAWAVVLGIWCAVGCDLQENKLLAEQATTFEQEIAYRQRKEIELENKIKLQQESISKLERALECQKE